MRLWIQSDQHLEATRGWDLPPPAERPVFDAMILAGDLVPGMYRGVKWLAQRITDRPVFYVAGNHEAYGRDVDKDLEKAKQEAAGTSVVVLNNDRVDLMDTLFVGAPLWTDFDLFGNRDTAMARAGDGMNDYKKIRKDFYSRRLRPADTLARHRESCEFIARSVRESGAKRKVVITHHAPVREAVPAVYDNDLLSAAYASHRPDLLEGVDLWIYGHTHETRDFTVGNTRVVSNAKGYGPWTRTERWENPAFDPFFIVEI
jgi:predicted phosphodiesterase